MENTMKTGKIGTLGAESRFTYGGLEWVALESRPNMVLALAVDVLKDESGETRYMPFDTENGNDFAAASIRAFLNGDFLEELAAAGADKEAFVPMVVDLTSDDGWKNYGKDVVKIGLITDQMYRDFRKIIPPASAWWWTATPSSVGENGRHRSRNVIYSGALDIAYANTNNRGARPICCLKSETLVSFDVGRINERTPSIGEMLGKVFADSLKEAIFGEKVEERPTQQQGGEDKPTVDWREPDTTPSTAAEDHTGDRTAKDMYARYRALRNAGFDEPQAWELFTRELYTPGA